MDLFLQEIAIPCFLVWIVRTHRDPTHGAATKAKEAVVAGLNFPTKITWALVRLKKIKGALMHSSKPFYSSCLKQIFVQHKHEKLPLYNGI